jgi:hypothetical protein
VGSAIRINSTSPLPLREGAYARDEAWICEQVTLGVIDLTTACIWTELSLNYYLTACAETGSANHAD